MGIIKYACAGTMESSDVYIEIEPGGNGIDLDIESVVKKQFGDKIKSVTLDVLKEHGICDAVIRIMDKGALECVLRARLETAVMRGKGEN